VLPAAVISFGTIRPTAASRRFCSIAESEHDIMGAGHASTSIGYAVGIKEAMRARGDIDAGRVVAVIGDGAMTGGVAFEAIHQAGGLGTPIVVILNRQRHVDRANVGAMSRSFNRVRLNPRPVARARRHRGRPHQAPPPGSAPRSSVSDRTSRSRSRPSRLRDSSGRSSTGPTSASSTGTTCAPCGRRSATRSPRSGPLSSTSRRSRARAFGPAENGGLEGMEKWHAAKPRSIANGEVVKPSSDGVRRRRLPNTRRCSARRSRRSAVATRA